MLQECSTLTCTGPAFVHAAGLSTGHRTSHYDHFISLCRSLLAVQLGSNSCAMQVGANCICVLRYTGYVQGMQETYKKTPVMAQLETKQPGEESFVYTRTQSPPKSSIASKLRDPCNSPKNYKKAEQDNLWPNLQEKAAQVDSRSLVLSQNHAVKLM